MNLFWTIVAALLFVSIGIPIIIYVVPFLLVVLIYLSPVLIPWIIALFSYISGDQGAATIWFVIGLIIAIWFALKYSDTNNDGVKISDEKPTKRKRKFRIKF